MTRSSLTQRIQALARTKSTLPKKAPPLTKSQLQKLDPDSLQAKLATSAYAAILASPMRYCTFHRKCFPSRKVCFWFVSVTHSPFPSGLLQRFELGLHPETHAAWAFPSDTGDGHGYYAKLHAGVLAQVQKQDHKRMLRGMARYSKNMNQYLNQQMMQALVDQSSLVQYTRTPSSDDDYQCILLLKPPLPSTPTITTTTTYALYTPPWQPLYDALLAHLGEKDVPASLGVVKSMDSVPFAVALFRYHQWLLSLTPSLLKS
ncbi:unnamed protein product [Absidia cylindrospora]